MRIDNGVALSVKNIAEREELEQTGFTRTSLSDDVDVARTVVAEHTELVVDAAEIRHPKSRDVFVNRWITGDDREFGWRFGGLGVRPDYVWRFDICVWQVENTGDLLDIHQIPAIGKEAGFVFGQGFFGEAVVRHLETIEVG